MTVQENQKEVGWMVWLAFKTQLVAILCTSKLIIFAEVAIISATSRKITTVFIYDLDFLLVNSDINKAVNYCVNQ